MNIFINKMKIKKYLFIVTLFLGILSLSGLVLAANDSGGPLPFYNQNQFNVGYQSDIPGYTSSAVSGGGSVQNSGSSGGGNGAPRTFYDLIMNTIIGGMVTPIIALIVTAGVVVFLYGVFKFIRSEGKEKEAGKQFMVWGIVGIFVMVSVWGLVNVLKGTFNLDDSQIEISNVVPDL